VSNECVEVVITAEDADWLASWTRQLVDDRLVACGHHISGIRAIYRWDGKVHDDPQARVALHTRAELVPRSSPAPTPTTPMTCPASSRSRSAAGTPST
jgi:periplasmic divalent cation tolerance protein